MSTGNEKNDDKQNSALGQADISVSQEMAVNLVQKGLVNLNTVFRGKLINHQNSEQSLTEMGKLLSAFFLLAEKEGFPLRTTLEELGKINKESATILHELGN